MKKQRLRERTLIDVKKSKQSTFDKLPQQKASLNNRPEKSIVISQLDQVIKDNELELSVAFRLLLSKNSSKPILMLS